MAYEYAKVRTEVCYGGGIAFVLCQSCMMSGW